MRQTKGLAESPMTTMIERFFGMPQALLRQGLLCKLSGSAMKLLIAVYHESERRSTRRLKLSTTELILLTGLSRNSLAKARIELINAGLVQIELNKRQEFVIDLCNPETGQPWPGDPKRPLPYHKKGSSFTAPPPDTAGAIAPLVETRIEVEYVKKQTRASGTVQPAFDRAPSPAERPPQTSIPRNARREIDARCDVDLSDTAFPFGYNARALSDPDQGGSTESFEGIFDS